MKRSGTIAAAIIVAMIAACNNSDKEKTSEAIVIKTYDKLAKANWLIGSWQSNADEGNAIETWTKQNDSVYAGKSYFIIGKDTVSSESILLKQTGDELSYNPTVKNQNDNKEVKFTLTAASATQLVFENPAHDFPQKITYTNIGNDSLEAEISGLMKGKASSEKFKMARVKE